MKKYNDKWFKRHIIAVAKYDQLKALADELDTENDPSASFVRAMQERWVTLMEVSKKQMQKTR